MGVHVKTTESTTGDQVGSFDGSETKEKTHKKKSAQKSKLAETVEGKSEEKKKTKTVKTAKSTKTAKTASKAHSENESVSPSSENPIYKSSTVTSLRSKVRRVVRTGVKIEKEWRSKTTRI